MMTCRGCRNEEAYQVHGWVDSETGYNEVCDRCGGLSSSMASVPDVFWNNRPYYSEALGVEFTSRSQKARVMKEMGVSELGNQKVEPKNWVEGSRAYRGKQFEKDRPMIRETYKRYLDNVRKK